MNNVDQHHIELPEIHVTKDYSVFLFLDANRDIVHEKKIEDSINKIGLIPAPIICNDKMQVIDGQGRVKVCEKLGLPVFYIIVPGLGVKDCISMNVSQTPWNMLDYIKSYASQGNENYIKLLDLVKSHPSISIKVLTSVLHDVTNGVSNDIIKRGEFTMDTIAEHESENLCEWIEDIIIPLKSKIKGRFDFFCFAVLFIYRHTDANNVRLQNVIQDYAYEFSPIGTTLDALTQMERFYNKNLNAANRVYFTSEYEKYVTLEKSNTFKKWKTSKMIG